MAITMDNVQEFTIEDIKKLGLEGLGHAMRSQSLTDRDKQIVRARIEAIRETIDWANNQIAVSNGENIATVQFGRQI